MTENREHLTPEWPALTVRPFAFPGEAAAPESAYRRGWDLLAGRAPREALKVIEPALEDDPENRGLRSLRAWAFLMRAQIEKAETELRSLVEDDPSDVWSRHALGRALERQSRYSDALPHFRMAAVMSGDPEHEYDVLRVERLAGKIA